MGEGRSGRAEGIIGERIDAREGIRRGILGSRVEKRDLRESIEEANKGKESIRELEKEVVMKGGGDL
jgi:hypothetical protein